MAKMFRLVLTQTYQGVLCNNVFHYQSASDAASQADDLCLAFETSVVPSIEATQNTGVSTTQIYAVDTDTFSDYHSRFPTSGGDLGDANSGLSPFIGMSITLNTTGSAIRHGFKRFTGQDRSKYDVGLPVAGFIGTIATLLGVLDNVISSGGFFFTPMVASYDDSEPPVIVDFTPVVLAVFRRLSSQNTRKR